MLAIWGIEIGARSARDRFEIGVRSVEMCEDLEKMILSYRPRAPCPHHAAERRGRSRQTSSPQMWEGLNSPSAFVPRFWMFRLVVGKR